jgi:hypothetical protein
MPEPTACARARSYPDADDCDRCNLLVGLDGFHVIDVAEGEGRGGVSLPVVVESPPRQEGCRVCGVIAHRHGRRTVRLVDAPCMGRPVELVWRKRTWRCGESTCPTGGWTELEGDLARPRALLTTVGDRSAASRARLGGRSGPAAGHDLADRVEVDPTAARSVGRGRDQVRRCDRARGRRGTCGTTCPPSLWIPAAAARRRRPTGRHLPS